MLRANARKIIYSFAIIGLRAFSSKSIISNTLE